MMMMNRETARAFAITQYEKLRRQFDDLDALRQRLDYQTYLLAACALLASLLMGFGDLITKGSIEQRQAEDLQATLGQVLPADIYDNDILAERKFIDSVGEETGFDRTEVYVARKGSEFSAAAFKLLALGGYSGAITLMMGVDKDGKLLGVRVIAHAETPGLGDKIEAQKSNWILEFAGKSLENTPLTAWRVKKDGGEFDQFAGATVTPRAVVKGVAGGLQFFERHKGEIR